MNDNARPAYAKDVPGLSGFDKKLSSACPDATVLDGLSHVKKCTCFFTGRTGGKYKYFPPGLRKMGLEE